MNLFDAIANVLVSFFAQSPPVAPSRKAIVKRIRERHAHLQQPNLDIHVARRLFALEQCGILARDVGPAPKGEKMIFYAPGPKMREENGNDNSAEITEQSA